MMLNPEKIVLPSTGGPRIAAGLGIETGTVSAEAPFWHRRDPVVAVTRLDAGYRELKETFPASWQPLVEVKALLDAIDGIEVSCPGSSVVKRDAARPLLLAAADKLTQVSAAEKPGQNSAAAQSAAAASRLRTYERTGEWPLVSLAGPAPREPWLYCGPLSTWAFRTCDSAISLLVLSPRPDMQAAPDGIDTSFDEVQAAVEQALGGAARFTKPVRPAMHAMDLLLAGGGLSSGHKHFAHFFPLEAPCTDVDGPEFTVVFANVHQHRLRRCSLRLLDWYLGDAYKPCSLREITLASLSWFRAHDIAHFWRLHDTPDDPAPALLSSAERMALEEGYADILGLISAAALYPPVVVSQAFAAEMLRYASRDQSRFCDSAAAALTMGWLINNEVTRPPGSAEWLADALPVFGTLARVIHKVRWEAQVEELPILRAAMRAGQALCAGLNPLFASMPTDLDYSFG